MKTSPFSILEAAYKVGFDYTPLFGSRKSNGALGFSLDLSRQSDLHEVMGALKSTVDRRCRAELC